MERKHRVVCEKKGFYLYHIPYVHLCLPNNIESHRKSEPHIHFKAEQTKNCFDLSSIMSCDHKAYCVQIAFVLSGVSTFKKFKTVKLFI